MTIVAPKSFQGDSHTPLQLFGIGPKFTVRCGGCGADFEARAKMVDRPRLKCPECAVLNELPLEVEER